MNQVKTPAPTRYAVVIATISRVLDRLIFVFLLTVIVFTAIPYGTVEPWWESVFECAVFAVTALWLFDSLLRGDWRIRKLSIVIPLVLITAFAFLQGFHWPLWFSFSTRLTPQRTLSIDAFQTYLTARKMVALTLFLGLLIIHTSSPRRLRWLVHAVVGLGLASAIFGFLRQTLQSPDSPAGFVLPFLFYGIGYGQFIYHNIFAYLMEMTFAIVAGLVMGGGIRRDRILVYAPIAIMMWAALVLSNSRGGFLSLICQVAFISYVSLTWYSARRASESDGGAPKWLSFIQHSLIVRALVIAVILGSVVISVLWIGGEQFASRLEKTASQDNADGLTRTAVWRSSMALVKDNPWTGVGFGDYYLAIPQYHRSSGQLKLEQAHNDYLDLAASGGLVAIGLSAWFLCFVVWRARYALRSRDSYRRAACLGALTGMLSIGVHSFVDFSLQVTSMAVVFGALIVIAIADGRVELKPRSIERLVDRDRKRANR